MVFENSGYRVIRDRLSKVPFFRLLHRFKPSISHAYGNYNALFIKKYKGYELKIIYSLLIKGGIKTHN